MTGRFFRSLSSRLMFTHMLVALIALLTVIMLLASGVGPLQRELAHRRLNDILQISVILNSGFSTELTDDARGPMGLGLLPRLRGLRQQWVDLMEQQAEMQDVRLVVLDQESQQVLLDTDNELLDQSWAQVVDAPPLLLRMGPSEEAPLSPGTRGTILLNNNIWYFRTAELLTGPDQNLLLVALQPRLPWRRALGNILGDLPRRLGWAAGLLLFLLIWLLSAGMARLLTRSLQPVITGTQAIATGDLDYRVPTEDSRLQEISTLANSFNHMAEEVQKSRKSQRIFLANVGHDLKTPLTGIQGFAQALMDGTAATPEAQQQAARIIHDDARRLAKLVDDILDLARLDSDGLLLEKRPIDLRQQLEQLVEAYTARSKSTGISLEWHRPVQPLLVVADPNHLERVFTNLLDNAFAHTSSGGTITVSAESTADAVEIAVSDTGSGIPPGDLERVFERFYQVNKSRSGRRGSGLGLSIVREIIEAHGGQVGVESVAGLGSRFWVQLPKMER